MKILRVSIFANLTSGNISRVINFVKMAKKTQNSLKNVPAKVTAPNVFLVFLQCQIYITKMCKGPPNEALKVWHDSQPNHFRRILVLNGKNYSQKNWLFIRSKYCDFGNLILQIVFVFFRMNFLKLRKYRVFFYSLFYVDTNFLFTNSQIVLRI